MNTTNTNTKSGVSGTLLYHSQGVVPGRGGNKASQVVIQRNPYGEKLKIGTWNVRTMRRDGKIENVEREMERYSINVLGLCEVRWKNSGELNSDSGNTRIAYSGGDKHRNGVALMFDKATSNRISKLVYHSDRIMLARMRAEPRDIVIVMVYMPTSEHADEEIDEIYEQIETLLKSETGKFNTVLLGDWNAVVGEGREKDTVGKFGLGKRNSRGEKLIEFCERNRFMIANTWFNHPKRRRYTWKKPGDTGRYQLDYILVKQRYRNSVSNARSYPGADADSDHNLVMMNMRVRLKKIHAKRKSIQWNRDMIRDVAGQKFRNGMEESVKGISGDMNDVDLAWIKFKTCIQDNAKKFIGQVKRKKAKKAWITECMIDKMEERRKWKNVSTVEGRQTYRKINNDLRRETDRAREEWWKNQCQELEQLHLHGRSDLVYNKIKSLCGLERGQKSAKGITSGTGQLLTDPEDIKERWKQYLEQLYAKDEKPEEIVLEKEELVLEDSKGPEIMLSEVEKAIRGLSSGKAVGTDDIPAEMFKVLGHEATEAIHKLCNRMYITGEWPRDFTKTVMIPLEKKPNTTKCEEHRTISLITHASKIMLKILNSRIEAKAEEFLGEDQFGFRRGRGTREAIATMRILGERSIEHGLELYTCFVDYEKAFDRVNWEKLLEVLRTIGVDWRDRRIVRSLYMDQVISMRVADGESDPSAVGRGVRQGCPLSPLLFNIYAEAMVKEGLQSVADGVCVGGESVKAVRFADDQAMVADTADGLQRMMDSLNNTVEEFGMRINIRKTKVMVISKNPGGTVVRINVNGQVLDQVSSFQYLGSTLAEDGRSTIEVNKRIAMAKNAFMKRKELLSKSLDLDLKKRIVKTFIWSVLLYGAETWTLRKEERSRLEAFEMWIWRKLLNIMWRDHITNIEVLARIGEERYLIECIEIRKINWLGHNIRHAELMIKVLEGRLLGKRQRGRPRVKFIDSCLEKSGCRAYHELKNRALNRTIHFIV